MLTDIALAYGVVLVAELGDKTQLVALTATGRHGAWRTLGALTAALVVLQTMSVVIGASVASFVPDRTAGLIAGLLFIVFGVWTLLQLDKGGAQDARHAAGRVDAGLLRVAAVFFLAELGDKTMLATASLATDRSPVGVWVGSFAAMVTATALAVFAGAALAHRLSTRTVELFGGIIFLIVGIATTIAALL
ncbi:MAG: TMEM165/GDT1 family protein [Actinomycetota bacterium]